MMVETGGREALKLFASPLKIKEARKQVDFDCSAELSEGATYRLESHHRSPPLPLPPSASSCVCLTLVCATHLANLSHQSSADPGR